MKDYPEGEVCRHQPGMVHPLVGKAIHYPFVPKERDENWKFRINLRRVCQNSKPFQNRVMKMCADDFLFFMNSVCYLIEPRIGEQTAGFIPFNTWAHQDPVFASLDFYFGERHIIGDKSRAQGASWGEIANLVHKFIFRPYSLLGMGSKNEEAADLPDNPDSLGWKFDFIMRHLPSWMRPPGLEHNGANRKLSDHTWKNVLNGSTLKAYSATAGIGRSGRFTSFFLDESAFFPPGRDSEAVSNLLNTTNGLVMLSTPNGMNNEHYDRVHSPGPWLSVVLDWRDNPEQSQGKYTTTDGKLELVDKDYVWPSNYKYVLDGRIRSPWYDRKCAENKHNMLLVGQEIDREYMGSKGRPFPKEAIESNLEMCRAPMHTGQLMFYEHEPEIVKGHSWVEGEGYRFDVWVPIVDGQMPLGHYTVGCDISAGVGGDMSSNSVACVFNGRTREQVAEFSASDLAPEKFAEYVLAICYWTGRGTSNTYLNWEKNGPGIRFTNHIMRSNYGNVFYQKAGDEQRLYSKASDKPGYYTSKTQLTLTPLIAAMVSSSITIRSRALIEECSHYVFSDKGNDVEYPRAKTSRDGGSKGQSHGDRAIAAAIAVRSLDERPMDRNSFIPDEVKVVPESMKGRWDLKQRAIKQRQRSMCKW